MRKILLATIFCLFAWPAFAVTCPVTTLQVKDNGNVTANMATGDDGSGAGNCEATVQIKQGGNTAGVTTHGLSVDGSGVTQPISAASLPLPTGAATSANQATITTWASGTLGAMANYGTSPGAVLVPGVNAFVTNTINAAQAGTWNINNISGTISLPTGAATAANQATAAAQASTTSGQTGPLVQCAVTTSAPSYTTAQTDPLSCDTGGLLRMRLDGGSAINPNGAAAIASSSPVTAASINVTATDCSGSITSGGTAQNAFAANSSLHGFTVANLDTTEPLWISFTTTAAASTAGSYPLAAATATTFQGGGSYTSPLGFGLNHALSVIAATTSHKFSCTTW